jgi:hypothetical protein
MLFIINLKKYLPRHGSTCTHPYRPKKMDPLFLGVFNVIPGCKSWVFCRKPTGAYGRASTGDSVHEIDDRRSEIGYNGINLEYQAETGT